MAVVTFKGQEVETVGNLPEIGENAPDFTLVANDLSEKNLKDYKGKRIVMNIFPSIDTGVCAASVRKFNEIASQISDSVVLCISRDLPFAQARFCGAEGLENVETLSDFRTGEFGKKYGVLMSSGPLAYLLARAVVIVDENGVVRYTQLVPEITTEPNYQEVLNFINSS